MIRVSTKCEQCIHQHVCRHKNNAENDAKKLSESMYGNGPNDDYDWGIMTDHNHVVVTFSCVDFHTKY